MKLVPVITSSAGMTLTGENWREAGVDTVSCHLVDLLIKPGYETLLNFSCLATYTGWTGQIILNASSLRPLSQKGFFTLRSPYDGSSFSYNLDELLKLIVILKPDYVILPAEFNSEEFAAFGIRQLDLQSEKDYLALKEIQNPTVQFIESDKPAFDAFEGRAYSSGEMTFIEDERFSTQFEPLDQNCQCPVCKQKFTKAYLHHLFLQTPLLCQRYLIQHNVFFYQQTLFELVG